MKCQMICNPFSSERWQDQEEPAPEEWKVDSEGRRFRKVGNVIEYAMTLKTTVGEVYKDQLPGLQKRIKEQQEADRKREAEAMAALRTGRTCPFKRGRNMVNSACEKTCAFYCETSCVFASIDTPAAKDTQNMYCVIAQKCKKDCAMYNQGCTVIKTIKGIMPER